MLFTYKAYEELLIKLKSNGYGFTDYYNWKTKTKSFVIHYQVFMTDYIINIKNLFFKLKLVLIGKTVKIIIA